MNVYLLLIILLTGLLGGLAGSDNTRSRARDIERKNDIRSLHSKLEEFYTENSYYPRPDDLENKKEDLLLGTDPESFIDPSDSSLGQGDYTYSAEGCTSLGCREYTLSAKLEEEDNFTKKNLF